MKRNFSAALLSAFIFMALSGCSSSEKHLTTASVIQAFRDAGIPIGEVISYDASSDSNHLLGRPGQYVAKANWADSRIEQSGSEPKGGTVEIFQSQDDLNKRKDYLAGFQDSPMLGFYMFAEANAIVRVEHDLTPDQSAEYENALKNATDSSENLPAGTIKTNAQSNTSTTAAIVSPADVSGGASPVAVPEQTQMPLCLSFEGYVIPIDAPCCQYFPDCMARKAEAASQAASSAAQSCDELLSEWASAYGGLPSYQRPPMPCGPYAGYSSSWTAGQAQWEAMTPQQKEAEARRNGGTYRAP